VLKKRHSEVLVEAKRAYIRATWYDSRSAKRHLTHLTRERTTIQNPKWEVYGDMPEEYLLARTPRRTRPIKNRIFEVMTYVESLGEMSRVWEYLEKRLNRAVNCYCHFDEKADHVHFVCRVADDDGRALRLRRTDLVEMCAKVAALLGRRLSPRGTGRRQLALKELKANPGALEAAKDDFGETIRQIDELMTLYVEYDRVRIACRRGTNIRVVREIDPMRPVRDQLRYRALRRLEADGFEVLFAPVPQAGARVVCLGLVPEAMLTELPAGAIVVQATEHAYEAHIPISLPLSRSGVAQVQRFLCSVYESDRASVAPDRYYSLPGFHEARIRGDVVCSGRALSIAAIKADLKGQRQIQEKAAEQLPKNFPSNLTWRSLWQTNRDLVDLLYASRLAEQCYGADEIRNAVLSESEDIVIRKRAALGGYLDRIVHRAGEHVEAMLSRR
jgi:hypothetical protein